MRVFVIKPRTFNNIRWPTPVIEISDEEGTFGSNEFVMTCSLEREFTSLQISCFIQPLKAQCLLFCSPEKRFTLRLCESKLYPPSAEPLTVFLIKSGCAFSEGNAVESLHLEGGWKLHSRPRDSRVTHPQQGLAGRKQDQSCGNAEGNLFCGKGFWNHRSLKLQHFTILFLAALITGDKFENHVRTQSYFKHAVKHFCTDIFEERLVLFGLHRGSERVVGDGTG